MAFFTNVVDLQVALSACLTVRDWEMLTSLTVRQALKAALRSTTLLKKAIFKAMNVSTIQQSFQISSECKLNEEMMLSKSNGFYSEHIIDSTRTNRD